MRETIVPLDMPRLDEGRPSRLDLLARGFLFRLLDRIGTGAVTILEGPDVHRFGRTSPHFPSEIHVTVHHPRFFSATVFGGTIGAAEAYMAGYWSTDDLTSLIRAIIRNQLVFDGMEKGWAWLRIPFHLVFHALHRNTVGGSRINIAAHYDLGNDFYSLLLDKTMTYSCGIFEKPGSTLEDASTAKYDRICRKLGLSPRDHVMEIGTGWGGFALHAARNYGCRITTTTLSRAQHDLAIERVREAGLEHLVTVLLEDYRKLRGAYDRLVSIEMIEAVGHHYLDTFFQCCSRLLKEDGAMLLQAITIQDQVFDRHKKSVDFIKRHIFPGSCIPSVAAIAGSVARATNLRLANLEDLTSHYVRTLRGWRNNFHTNLERVRSLGYSETFIRMWDYYLCYCEAGFAERYLGDGQFLFTKPLYRGETFLP